MESSKREAAASCKLEARSGLWLVACGLWLVACGLWLVACGLQPIILFYKSINLKNKLNK
ncbi:hypothetical protein C1Y34_30350 [Pseudomonas sp. GW456-L12]|nr:hypothetical protein C1Y34_30350 [Pseudomonas sp. GW456-L12]